MSDVCQTEIFFSGRVQGVGFRYTTLQIAKEFEVAGTVSNLTDGRVLLRARGRRGEVDAFITAVEDRMHGYIKKVERSSTEVDMNLNGFQII